MILPEKYIPIFFFLGGGGKCPLPPSPTPMLLELKRDNKTCELRTFSAVIAALIMSEYLGWSDGFFAFAAPPARFLVTFAGAAAGAASDILELLRCFSDKELRQNANQISNTTLTPSMKNRDDAARQKRAYKANARTSLRLSGRGHTTAMNGDQSLSPFVFFLFTFVVIIASSAQFTASKFIERCRRIFSSSVARVVTIDTPQFVL